MIRITPYQAAEKADLAAFFGKYYQAGRPGSMLRRIKHVMSNGGRAWVLTMNGSISGYAAVVPVPGLEGAMELEGFIRPDRRRQGAGSQLLAHLLDELKPSETRQISHCVTDLESAAAHFLRHHHFSSEHEEQAMIRTSLANLPSRPDADLRHFARSRAIPLFCELYDKSFSGFPWFQPYTETEVAATLEEPADLQFLFLAEEPIGFVWIRWSNAETGEIEPLGVIQGFQGKGYGRTLLLAGLHDLASRGAREVKIGAWCDNHVAIALYESLGFRRAQIFTYLARDL